MQSVALRFDVSTLVTDSVSLFVHVVHRSCLLSFVAEEVETRW